MGRHKRHGKWKGKKGEKESPEKEPAPYETRQFTTENKAFEAYYKHQLQQEFADEAEYNVFKTILRERLPVVFRINENVPNYQNFLQKLKDNTYIEKLLKNGANKEEAKPAEENNDKIAEEKKLFEQLKLKNIPWYPRELVWQLSTFRHELKKNKAYQNLHKFIHRATEAGLISRQELVSMLPPLLLDVQSTDIIFDMCAAPGSKTAQLLELLYKDEALGKGLTQGGVVANDIDYRRASMLIHQVQRISTSGMMVVNHSAQYFPSLKSTEIIDGNTTHNQFFFDKILADVPCSGDGAIRKLPGKWAQWSAKDGTGLHPLQLQILIRAIQLVKVGGLVLYSTCSINPIEDEAVITELFRRCKDDTLELVDIREKVPGLIGRPGLASWTVCEEKPKEEKKEGETIAQTKGESAEDFFDIYKSFDQLPEGYKGVIKASMFPDTVEKMRDVYKIQNSLRLMPHDQNTGGFYLALIRKKAHTVFDTKDLIKTKMPNESANQAENAAPNAQVVDEEVKEPIGDNEENIEVPEGENADELEEPKGDEDEDLEEGEKEESEEEEKEDKPAVEGEKKTEEAPKKKSKRNQEIKKKVTFESFDPKEWDWIKEYYGLDESLKDLFIQQTVGDRKVLMISPGIKKLIDLELEKDKTIINKLNMGAKALFRNREVFLNDQYPYRLCQDAISSLFPFITKRKIKVSAQDLITMVEKQNLRLHELPSDDMKEKIKEAGQGCVILYAENDGPIKDLECIVCLSMGNSVSIMVSRELIESLKMRYTDLAN